jgi:hypothetical protein
LATAALAGCGGDSQPVQEGIGNGQALQLGDCTDWNSSSVDQRLETIAQLKNFAGGPVGNIDARGAVLDDDDAYDLMEADCEPEYARGFKLYKLYVRAAAFSGH